MKIAAIIPVHNEAWNIRRIIYNLLHAQDYGHHQLDRIIVVCSGCTDGTDVIAKEIAKRNEKVCVIVERVRCGKTRALNRAIKALENEAKEAEVIVFLSGDVVPQRNSLKHLASILQNPSVGCAIAHPIPLNSRRKLSGKLVNILWSLHDEMNHLGWHKVTGEMFAIKRSILEEIPENVINDDLYIEYLVNKQEMKFAYVPDAIVYIWGPESLIELLEQRRRVNLGHLQIAQQYKAQHLSVYNTIRLSSILIVKYNLAEALIFSLVEGFSRLIAHLDNFRGKHAPAWKMIRTSKGGIE